ncbi:multidrug DMT transporter [Pseudomonas sp. HMWF032]|uniref:DNA cytosine methyltransferase n=1 Tax=Pseudomonas sp. HMWF032 TaxID=2056866 RepID=UPI000D342E09|nr:DNA cytosine methyltransferase [Pseudomonas sp. HMWF032]PTS84021.1 multidrug DMT transporter [Pseudomonas sp. HMWF032]PTT85376.1 multidrug DMT transporter [Pseudomonas sp. HMWF010]
MTSLKKPAPFDFHTQYGLALDEIDDEINVDLFAGGGGASTGLEMGLGRPVHIAINHNPAAISMHEANHPGALHLQTDVWAVDPVQVLAGRRIGWFHASPDCTHHSQAAGGQPRKKEVRDLSWVVVKWAGIGQPRIISLENVKQIRQWGPLIAKRCKKTGRVMKLDGTVAAPGERTPRGEQFLVPDPKRKGTTWLKFLGCLRALGYTVEHNIIKACDFGAPTSRERLFLVARRDGKPIVWPKPTHAAKPGKGQKPYRTAAECIDFSLPSQSIFDRKKPLADATERRIAKGIKREVLQKAKPFIVPIANWSRDAMHPVDQPLNTVTAWPRGGSFALASPTLVGVGGRAGQTEPRSADSPMYTITSKGDAAVATCFLEQANGGFNTMLSRGMDQTVSTVTNSGSQQRLVTANLVHLRGNCDVRDVEDPLHTVSAGGTHHALATAFLSRQFGASVGQGLDEPSPTITAGGGGKSALVELKLSPDAEEGALRCAAFLMKYHGIGENVIGMDEPVSTVTTKDRLALVTVWIGGDPYVIVDICLRMLQPHELYAAQGFPPSYIITRGHDGRKFTKSEQVFMCGNSVSPPPMAAIAAANDTWSPQPRQALAA